MEKTIKYRLFHYFVEQPNPSAVGTTMLVEKFATLGQTVDIPRQVDIDRGERVGAFFTDEEISQIEKGSYTGPGQQYLADHGLLGPQLRAPEFPGGRIESGEPDASVTGDAELGRRLASADGAAGGAEIDAQMSAEEVADIIENGQLNVQQTVALAKGDPDLAELVLDAENLATNNEPRKGVTSQLEAVMASGGSAG